MAKGVRIFKTNGVAYVQVRIMRNGRVYTQNFGQDSSLARELAGIHASEKYKEFLMGKFGIRKEPEDMKFEKARCIFHKRHFVDYRDPSTNALRTKGSIDGARWILDALGRFFDKYSLHEITILLIKEYRTRRLDVDKVSNATFNKEKGILSSLIKQIGIWVAEGSINPVKLPEMNPCKVIPRLTENQRHRVPDTWELAEAYQWCKANDPGLWDGIEGALKTALRKQDLIALDDTLTVKGIQQKTGEKFDLPLTLAKPVDLTNFQQRWNALRKALGWATVKTPKHTTWHDLRHWAPTMLGESGFTGKIIQAYLGHKKEETSERYTNIRQKALEPAVDHIQQAIEKLKG